MISFDEAVALVAQAARPLAVESVDLERAAGRILANPVVARIDSPIADVSAMDGYAVHDADVDPGARLAIVGESFPGAGYRGVVGRGQGARIFTGAPIPEGTDRVVVQEVVRCDAAIATFTEIPGSARHIRKRGSDFKRGATILEAGTNLNPGALIAAAGADVATLSVWHRPRLCIVSTGDELVAPGTASGQPDRMPESVSFGIAALAQKWGADVVGRLHLADDLASMQAVAAELLSIADIIVVTGGASVGQRDFSRQMFEHHDLETLFSKVAIKPGKPVWFGRAGKVLVIGLPGNPTSALVTARLLLAPLTVGTCGGDPLSALRWRSAPLAAPLNGCGERETFVRAAWHGSAVGPLSDQDSGGQRALADAELLLRQPALSPARDVGELVEILTF